MALQNLELDGKKSRFDWINLFDKIAFYASRQAWLRNPQINLTELFSPIFKAFTDTVAVEQARERLKQIKLLSENSSLNITEGTFKKESYFINSLFYKTEQWNRHASFFLFLQGAYTFKT